MKQLVRLLGALTVLFALTCSSVDAQTNSLGWITYIQDGDVWTVTLPNGLPQRLTADGKNSHPRISPSGEWIAFRKTTRCESPAHGCLSAQMETTLWVMERSGENARALAGCTVDWAPIQDMLYCTAKDGTLSIARAPNFVPEAILKSDSSGAETFFSRVAWSPEGSALAYTRDVQGKDGAAYSGTSLERIELETRANKELLNLGEPSQDGLIAAGWTPDANGILYWIDPYFSGSIMADGLALYLISTQAGTSMQLVSGMLTYRDFMSIAPRRNALAVAEGTGRASWTNKQIVNVDLRTGAQTRLTAKDTVAISPAWSPDEMRIAYASMPDHGDLVGGNDARVGLRERRIWLMNPDGSNKTQLTHDKVYRDEAPQWSNDASQILFARIYQPDERDESQDRAELWRMRADGTSLAKVLDLNDVIANSPYDVRWFGYYGHIAWDDYFDWWQPASKTNLPSSGGALANFTGPLCLGSAFIALGATVFVFAQIKNQKSTIKN